MKWKTSLKYLSLIILMILLILLIKIEKKPLNIYSWNTDDIDNIETINLIKSHKATSIYQYLDDDYLYGTDDNFIKNCQENGIDVYQLIGDPTWGRDETLKDIKHQIQKVVNYNKDVKHKIKGIVFDIEPYVNLKEEKFSKKQFKTYVEIIKETYQIMNENNLEQIICIPVWFDKIDEDLLGELIKNTDKIEVMNYTIDKTQKNIKTELEYSKQYNKKISTIYEIDFNDKEKFPSYQEINNDYNKIKEHYNYKNLEISYHYLEKMK